MNQPDNGGLPQGAPLPVSQTDSGYDERAAILSQIGKARDSKVLLHVTGDRPAMETQIGPDVDDIFVEHLDELWPARKISVVLYTTGGNTATAWRLINLLRTFCDELEIMVLVKALSAGTLMCLGANQIVMSKQSTLGPIDPSVNNPMNPQVPGTNPLQRAPVSVEAVQGYLDVAKELGVNDSNSLATVLTHLSSQIHPLVLGQIFRTRMQIRDLATKLLVHQELEGKKKEEIIDFLCSESGSHDHTINRREAAALGLKIEKPSEEFYVILRNLYKNVSATLKLRDRFTPDVEVANDPAVQYRVRRGLIETVEYGSHQFITEGILRKVQVPQNGAPPAIGVQNHRLFEGWKREDQP